MVQSCVHKVLARKAEIEDASEKFATCCATASSALSKVVMDLCCTCKVAYKINVGPRQKTYIGHLLKNTQPFAGSFESYATQRLLADNLRTDAFSATFLMDSVQSHSQPFMHHVKPLAKSSEASLALGGFMAEQLMPA